MPTHVRHQPTSGVPALLVRQPTVRPAKPSRKARRPHLRTRASSSSVRASVGRFNGIDPVTVINRQASVDAGFNSTAEVLQSVGVTGGTGQINDTFGGLVVEGGPGVNTLSLRGLGPTRTLILLNGRRIAPAGTRGQVGAADLNVLPNAVLDRIEVLNTGASSVYGSDAVAGVVNIVTLSKFNGLAVEAAVTAPEIGAGTTQRYAITAGTSGERFSVLGSLELFDRNRITQADQPWARCPQQRRLSPLARTTATSASRSKKAVSPSTRSAPGSFSSAPRPIRPTLRPGFQAESAGLLPALQPLAAQCC